MSDRETELRRLTARLRDFESVDDAFLAKSFTDRLIVVDVSQDESLPDGAADLLDASDLRGVGEVYGDGDENPSLVGDIGASTRHHFVDIRTRGSHQSYVVD